MKANWRVDVWGGEPLIADIVDIDTKRPVAQSVSTKVARFIVAMCASSESMNEDDLKFLKECEERTERHVSVGFALSPLLNVQVCRLFSMVREQDKRARHAEQERDAFDARIRELEAENKTLVDLEKSSSENAIRNAALAADRANKIKILEAQVASSGSSSGKDKP